MSDSSASTSPLRKGSGIHLHTSPQRERAAPDPTDSAHKAIPVPPGKLGAGAVAMSSSTMPWDGSRSVSSGSSGKNETPSDGPSAVSAEAIQRPRMLRSRTRPRRQGRRGGSLLVQRRVSFRPTTVSVMAVPRASAMSKSRTRRSAIYRFPSGHRSGEQGAPESERKGTSGAIAIHLAQLRATATRNERIARGVSRG